MALSMFFLLSIPVLMFIHTAFFEKHILLSSDSPEETYHIEISSRGFSNRILIEETTTASELNSFVVTELWVSVVSENFSIEWMSDTVAQITVRARRDTQNYFLFNADVEGEKIKERMPYSSEWD